jgi:hypothetical protein
MLCFRLALGLLDCSGWLLGRGGEVSVDLPLELTSSCLTVLAILPLMMGILPLKLLLRRALILLELQRWVA